MRKNTTLIIVTILIGWIIYTTYSFFLKDNYVEKNTSKHNFNIAITNKQPYINCDVTLKPEVLNRLLIDLEITSNLKGTLLIKSLDVSVKNNSIILPRIFDVKIKSNNTFGNYLSETLREGLSELPVDSKLRLLNNTLSYQFDLKSQNNFTIYLDGLIEDIKTGKLYEVKKSVEIENHQFFRFDGFRVH